MLAVERLMGLVLTALAVQMLLDGVRTFVTELARARDPAGTPGLARGIVRRRHCYPWIDSRLTASRPAMTSCVAFGMHGLWRNDTTARRSRCIG